MDTRKQKIKSKDIFHTLLFFYHELRCIYGIWKVYAQNAERKLGTCKKGLIQLKSIQIIIKTDNMSRILITGGAGFIGSHLCDRLLSEGNEVICLDNFFTGRRLNIKHNLSNGNFEFVRHDVTSPYMAEVDEIYNLACPASPVHYQYNAIKTMKTSVMGAINMLGLAKRIRAKILQASTSEVYGDPQIHKLHW